MDNNYYNNNNNSNNNSNQSSDSFYSYNSQQNNGNQNNAQNEAGSQAGGYGSTQSSIYGSSQSNGQSSGYGSTRSNGQGSGYGSTQSNGQSSGYTNTQNMNYGYGSNAGYQNHSYGANGSAYGNNPKPEKKKKERKPGGFGKQLAKCAALALVFGLVAGGVMTGVNYASGKILGTSNSSNVQASLTTGDDSTVKPTAVSSSYVANDVSDIVDEVMPSIVAITNVSQTEYQSFWGQSKTYESTSCGSGIIVGQDNDYLYVATNNHVVEGANSLTVTFANDDTVSAEIKGTDPSTDLAVVKVALSSIKDDTMSAIKVATLGSSDALKVGESCIAIGNALGYGQSVTTGVISALNREVSVSDSSSSTNYTAELILTENTSRQMQQSTLVTVVVHY
jgi:serine protease Do